MEDKIDNQGGIRLRRLNAVMISIAVLLSVALVLVSIATNRCFKELEQATERYIMAQEDAASMQAASDYLTDRARSFVVTGDVDSVEDFFREMEVTRRREKAVERMEVSLSGTDTARYLSEALQSSELLAEIERYAMHLAAVGRGLDIQTMPAPLQTVTLTAADQALSREKQLERARDLVFDETYQTHKKSIRDDIALCGQVLTAETEATQKHSAYKLENAMVAQTLLTSFFMLVVIAMVIYTVRLVFHPIESMVKAISENAFAEEKGAYEVRYVTKAYNKALNESRQRREELTYEATHDALTGLYNRGVFEKARQKTRGRARAMFIFDVDGFKSFNDEYGHDMGDLVLKKVAQTLQHNFRDEDYVCRFGGDEFTVIMVHVNSAMRDIVEKKLERIRTALKDTSDGLPTITLSIGVAFYDRPEPTDDILKDADTALYITKERGKDGYVFYGDEPITSVPKGE